MKYLNLNDSLKNDLIDDEDEETFTNNIDEAIFILNDGSLVSGEYYDGIRSLDHNSIKSRFEPETSWKQLHDTYNFIRLVPETKTALISGSQVISENVKNMLNLSNYEIETYC